MMNTHYFTTAALGGLTICLTLTGCRDERANDASPRSEMPPARVSVINMARQTVDLKTQWFGHLRGVEQAEIRPQVSGTLLRQPYWNGSICQKGELLFEIDPATYQAAFDQAAANLAAAVASAHQAEAAMDRARQDVERYDKLVRSGSVSEKNYTDSLQTLKETQAALEQAKAGVAQSKAVLENARINLDRTKVRAPFTGLASAATASVGDLISANGSPLTTMSSIDPIRVDFSVTGKQMLGRMMKGSVDPKTGHIGGLPEFELILEDGTVYERKGSIVAVDSEVSRASGTVSFIGHVPNPDLKLRSGMAVRVRAVTKRVENALLVPSRAVLSAMNHRTIMIAAPDKTPRRIDVQPGETLVLDVKNGDGRMTPMLMQIVTGTVKPIEESLREIGYENPADAPVIVEGGMMAAQYSKANELMRRKGVKAGFGTVEPAPFIYVKPTSTTPSKTTK